MLEKGWALINVDLLLPLLRDVKALWDEAGLGDDPERSEGVYNRLNACITQLEETL